MHVICNVLLHSPLPVLGCIFYLGSVQLKKVTHELVSQLIVGTHLHQHTLVYYCIAINVDSVKFGIVRVLF